MKLIKYICQKWIKRMRTSKPKLSKSVCQKCWQKLAEECGSSHQWTKYDERKWKRGFVSCTTDALIDDRIIPIDTIPPYCPYSLEHLTQ